jgi:hypothetical protein
VVDFNRRQTYEVDFLGLSRLDVIMSASSDQLGDQTLSFEVWRPGRSDSSNINPNWHEAGQIYPPYNFWIGFCQLNFFQKFPNIFLGEN